MDNLDIKIVDSLTVNLNQEEYSTEGQVQNGIDVYVEDEQQLFEAALTQDSIHLYTRETPDIISFDTKGIMDGISKLESQIQKTSKEATLIAKVAELKEALNTIDFNAIEQAIHNVKDVTAREATLIQGVGDIIRAVENIDFTDLENSIEEVKNAVVNIDFSALAKENTLTQGVNTISKKIDDINIPELDKSDLAKEATLSNGIDTLSNKIDNIDLSSVENKVNEGVETLSNKIDNIDLSAVENKVQEESTVIQTKIDNIKLPEIDTTELAKQGDDKNATLTAIYKMLVGNDEPSQDIPEGVAERLALILEFFGMKPIEAYEFMTAEEVCTTLENIMTSMDLGFTPEKAKEITNNTLTNALYI